MGCFDVFCFLCGNTCHGLLSDSKSSLVEFIETFEKRKSKLNEGSKLYIAPIYKEYNKNPKLFLNKIDYIDKNTKWLNKCTFLAANNKVAHGCTEVLCGNRFQDKNDSYVHMTSISDFDIMYGVFVHTDCWKFVKNEYNIKLNYSHLPIINKDIYLNNKFLKIFKFINYGTIEKYWDQDFNFYSVIIDSNYELCFSPLKSKLVGNNIKKIISKLKIRNDPDRKGPPVSATFYKNGLYKVGMNGNIWFVKNNKWMEIKDTIEYEISDYSKIKKKVFIGDFNDKPIFILNYTVLTIKDYSKKKF